MRPIRRVIPLEAITANASRLLGSGNSAVIVNRESASPMQNDGSHGQVPPPPRARIWSQATALYLFSATATTCTPCLPKEGRARRRASQARRSAMSRCRL